MSHLPVTSQFRSDKDYQNYLASWPLDVLQTNFQQEKNTDILLSMSPCATQIVKRATSLNSYCNDFSETQIPPLQNRV